MSTPAFYGDTLTSSLSKRVFDLAFPVGIGVSVPIVPIVIAMLFLMSLKFYSRFGYFAAVPFVMIVGIQFHPQWLMWSLPFFSILAVKHRLWFAYAIFTLGFLLYVFLFDDVFLNLALLGPLDAGVFSLPSPSFLLSRFVNPAMFQNTARLIVFFSGMWMYFKSINKDRIQDAK